MACRRTTVVPRVVLRLANLTRLDQALVARKTRTTRNSGLVRLGPCTCTNQLLTLRSYRAKRLAFAEIKGKRVRTWHGSDRLLFPFSLLCSRANKRARKAKESACHDPPIWHIPFLMLLKRILNARHLSWNYGKYSVFSVIIDNYICNKKRVIVRWDYDSPKFDRARRFQIIRSHERVKIVHSCLHQKNDQFFVIIYVR